MWSILKFQLRASPLGYHRIQVLELKQWSSHLVDMERCGVVEYVCAVELFIEIGSKDSVWVSPWTESTGRLRHVHRATLSAVLSCHTQQYCPVLVSAAVRGDLHVSTRKRRDVLQQCTAVTAYWPVSSPIQIAHCAIFGWQRATPAILSPVSRNIDWKSRPAKQPCEKRWGRFSFGLHV